MAAAVAGLGYMAGAAAGSYVKSKLAPEIAPGPDTRVPGISSATIKKGGKGQPDIKVPQVDISQSLQWFREAAETQDKYYTKGLDYYTSALQAASKLVESSFREANNTLRPMSYASNQALNEQMRMMGLDPISNTYGFKDRAKELGLGSVAEQMAKAEKIQNPVERANAKNQILASINKITSAPSTFGQEVAALGPKPLNASSYSAAGPGDNDLKIDMNNPIAAEAMRQGTLLQGAGKAWMTAQQYNAARDSLVAKEKDYNAKVAEIQAREDEKLAKYKEYNAFAQDFSAEYSDTYDKGYTGEQVSAKVAATPGYQFQMEQGTQAIERQGAARGMMGSGNTLTALTDYGQKQAQNFYGMYMDNLSRIVAEGSGATMQIAANQVQQGNIQSAFLEAGGKAGMQTQAAIGDAYANSLYKSGELHAQAAQFNASMQNAGIEGIRGREAQMAQQAVSSGPGYMNAATNQAQFNYGVFQNQQGGQQYYGGGAVTYPNYTGQQNNKVNV